MLIRMVFFASLLNIGFQIVLCISQGQTKSVLPNPLQMENIENNHICTAHRGRWMEQSDAGGDLLKTPGTTTRQED